MYNKEEKKKGLHEASWPQKKVGTLDRIRGRYKRVKEKKEEKERGIPSLK
jgi:hypothetical protein